MAITLDKDMVEEWLDADKDADLLDEIIAELEVQVFA